MNDSNQPQQLSDAADTGRFLQVPDVPQPKPLPDAYGVDRLTLLVRDPHCIFAFWETFETECTLEICRTDESGALLEILGSHPVPSVGSFYAWVPVAGAHYGARLLRRGASALWSRSVFTPTGRPSDLEDPRWMSIRALSEWDTVVPATGTSPGLAARSVTRWSEVNAGNSFSLQQPRRDLFNKELPTA